MNEKLDDLKQLKMLKSPSKKQEEKLKEKMKSRFDGRWVIVFLFLVTVIASLFFYLRTELPRFFGGLFSSEVVISKPPR